MRRVMYVYFDNEDRDRMTDALTAIRDTFGMDLWWYDEEVQAE